jgi:hypothetical protein
MEKIRWINCKIELNEDFVEREDNTKIRVEETKDRHGKSNECREYHYV